MEYKGKLYGRIGRKQFDLGKTSEDWDRMETALKTIYIWANNDSQSRMSRASAMRDIRRKADQALNPPQD